MNQKRLSEWVIGCALEVSKELGTGFLERVYENALAYELELAGIPFQRQVPLSVLYKGAKAGEYVCDLVVDGKLLLELKGVSRILPEHEAQVMNYLRATGLQVGLLLNFGTAKLGVKRIVHRYDETNPI